MSEIVSSSKPTPIFDNLLSLFRADEQQINNINEAKLLHSNGKFYYATNEYVGALVSYSCSAVLLNSIIRAIPDNTSTNKALFDNANELLNCCLRAVQTLQEKTKSSKPKDDADNSKDW